MSEIKILEQLKTINDDLSKDTANSKGSMLKIIDHGFFVLCDTVKVG